MRGRLLVLVVTLVAAGCVSPAADLTPASAALLQPLETVIPEAVSERLPNGDLQLTLTSEVAGWDEFEFELPEGVTNVEAVIDSDEAHVSVMLGNAESRLSRCLPQTWSSWNGRSDHGMRCTAIAAIDPATTWFVQVRGGTLTGVLSDLVEVPPMESVAPVSYTLTLTFSTLPLDGPNAVLKLDALSRPIYDAMDIEFVEVPASADGAGLHVEVTRPKTDEKVPVILRASPYNGPEQNAAGRAGGTFVDTWVARGYAVAVMDLRGTGKSDGCFTMRSVLDQTDIADTVEWLGTQDWSNGKVGMMGVSYVGFTPVAAAVQQPPHLAAIHIGAPAIDTYANYLPGGVDTGRSFSTALAYMSGNAALTPTDELPPDAVLHTVDAFCDPTILPKANEPRHLYDAWYAERNLTENVDKINVPVYYEHGFWDNNVKANAITEFFNALQVEKRGIFGSWQHISALRADQAIRALAWFDHWLKGVDTGILETPTMEVLTNTREWRAGDAWPTPGTTPYDIALADGQLAAVPPPAQGIVPVSGAIVTETDALVEKVYLSGVPLIDFTATATNGGTPSFEARLFEVQADGTEIFAGVGWINGAHSPDHTQFMPMQPGEARALQMPMLPQDHVFQVGSVIRIELRSATGDWGGPEAAIAPPSLVEITGATLRLPTLPTALLAPQPRSVS